MNSTGLLRDADQFNEQPWSLETTARSAATRPGRRSCKTRSRLAETGHRRGEGLGPARPRRRGLPHRRQVDLHAEDAGRRRSTWSATPTRASPAPARTATSCASTRTRWSRAWPSPATPWARPSATTTCAASSWTSRGSASRPRMQRGLRRRPARQEHPGLGRRLRPATSISAPAPTSAARRRRCSNRSKARRASRASSRRSPPTVGLYGKPTTVNNTETYASVPEDPAQGRGKWFADLGKPNNGGTKIFSVSGHVETSRQLRGAAGHSVGPTCSRWPVACGRAAS